jgi:hypothetical protein
LGGVLVLGLAAQGLTLLQSLLALCVGGGGLLLYTWLWEIALRREPPRRPPTAWQRVWGVAVFLGWLAAVAGVIWWYWG